VSLLTSKNKSKKYLNDLALYEERIKEMKGGRKERFF
jgi:hypothetical protein